MNNCICVADKVAQMDQETYRELLNARENRADSWEMQPSKFYIKDADTEVFVQNNAKPQWCSPPKLPMAITF